MSTRCATLVTGAGGFVGRHLVQTLVENGQQVVALSRRPVIEGTPPGVVRANVELEDESALCCAMAGISTVFHAAGAVPARGCRGMWETNVGGTRNVALACVRAGVRRLVLVSSVAVYRPPLADVVPESAPTGGSDLYGRSKAEAESEARRICHHELELVVARPCQIYGPNDGSGFTRRLLKLSGSPGVPVVGWNGRAFSLIHVRDVSAALLAAGESAAACGEVFNIAPDSSITLLEIARIQALVRRVRVGVRVPIPAMAMRAAMSLRATAAGVSPHGGLGWRSYAARQTHGSLLLGGPLYDSSNARTVLGFRPQTTVECGLAELLS